MAPIYPYNKEQMLDKDLSDQLDGLDEFMRQHFEETCSPSYHALYRECLRDGLLSLLGQLTIDNCKEWEDAMQYGRAVIKAPQDNEKRASEAWAQSVSDPFKELLTRFGVSLVEKAHLGAAKLVEKHRKGGIYSIPHINKKESFIKRCGEIQTASGYHPSSNPLAASCYEIGVVGCSIVMGAWVPAETAVRLSFVSHVSMSDDYAGFTEADYEIRIRMVALAAGAAYHVGSGAVRAFLDGTGLKAMGTSSDLSVEAAMAWRAASGCSTIYSKYVLEPCSMDEALMPPEIMLAMHDITDWRSDAAAGNYENGLSALYGMGDPTPFHTYLEATIKRALSYPLAGIHAIAGMLIMSYTASRYAAYEYKGKHKPACENCISLLRNLTDASRFKWAPQPPPRDFAESYKMSLITKRWVEHFENRGLAQLGAGWFQHLILTGEIWLFNVLEDGVLPVHIDTDWI